MHKVVLKNSSISSLHPGLNPALWLPYTQMQTASPPLKVKQTLGSQIILEDNSVLIDGIASWWTACHGYNHPYIIDAIGHQLKEVPHIMLGGLCHNETDRLATRLSLLLPGELNHVFFSESGSVAVEVALKIAIQYWINQGAHKKTQFISFHGAYHGDTLATMSLCCPKEGMHQQFSHTLLPQFVAELPENDEKEAKLKQLIEINLQHLAGIIVEPLVQGAAGMVMHDSATLKRLSSLAKEYQLPLIFDEIFVGFGRTGSLFACQEAEVIPDIICLSKALTGGTLPLAATVASSTLFEAFLGEPESAFMHGPTYMGHALACRAANASLDLFEKNPPHLRVQHIEQQFERLNECEQSPRVKSVCIKGAIAAVNFYQENLSSIKDALLKKGLWVRPIKSCLYLTPAFTISEEELACLIDGIVEECFKRP